MVSNLTKIYNIPVLNRLAYYLVKCCGCEIPINVKIGKNVSFPHDSVGTVIHPDTVIGDRVKIYQNVTIGRGDIWKEASEDFMGFEIKNDVILCAGAKIISSHGKRVIGENSIVAANAVVIDDVPPNCVVGGGTSENLEIPLVSVVVPIYNTASYLEKCIKSVINQSYKKIEIILVNDGSTDESLNICKQYEKADSRIRIVDKINGGLPSARNAGIDVAVGKYICFIDSDDFLESNFVEELVDGFRLHPNVDVTICNYFYNESEVRSCVRTYESSGEIRNRILTMIEIASPKSFKGFAWNKLYKMDLITTNSLRFDESAVLVEDALFNQEYMSFAGYSFYIDKPLYHYVQREGSLLHSSFNKEKLAVLPTYEKIIHICRSEENDELNKLLRENYLSHVITLMKLLVNDSDNKRRYFRGLKKILLEEFSLLVSARNISIKRKLLALLLILK